MKAPLVVEAIEIDGSFGEGGGQILRTSLTFSIIQHRAVRIKNIRAGREIPGLRQQHSTTVRLLGEIFGAEVEGAHVGSSEVYFNPGNSSNAIRQVDMKTAASITLLLQAVIPAAAITKNRLQLEITGGTDVPWSPTFDYFVNVIQPVYSSIGVTFRAEAQKRGYYPVGGGRVLAEIEPAGRVNPMNRTIENSEPVPAADLISRCSRLPKQVAERQLDSMTRALSTAGVKVRNSTLTEEESLSPGSSAVAFTSGMTVLGSDGIGSRGVRAEEVGTKAASGLISSISSGATVDVNQADMIAPILSLSDGPSSFSVPTVTSHLRTGMHVAREFTECDYSFRQMGKSWLVSIRPISGHNL